MFTVQTAADHLGTTDDHIRDLIHRGHLKAVNIGIGLARPRWRIPREALEEFKLARTAAAPQPAARRKRRGNPEVVQFYPE